MSKYKLFCDKCLKEEVYDDLDIVESLVSDDITCKCPNCGYINKIPKNWVDKLLIPIDDKNVITQKSERDKEIEKKEYVIIAQRQIISTMFISCWLLLSVIIILLLIHDGI